MSIATAEITERSRRHIEQGKSQASRITSGEVRLLHSEECRRRLGGHDRLAGLIRVPGSACIALRRAPSTPAHDQQAQCTQSGRPCMPIRIKHRGLVPSHSEGSHILKHECSIYVIGQRNANAIPRLPAITPQFAKSRDAKRYADRQKARDLVG